MLEWLRTLSSASELAVREASPIAVSGKTVLASSENVTSDSRSPGRGGASAFNNVRLLKSMQRARTVVTPRHGEWWVGLARAEHVHHRPDGVLDNVEDRQAVAGRLVPLHRSLHRTPGQNTGRLSLLLSERATSHRPRTTC